MTSELKEVREALSDLINEVKVTNKSKYYGTDIDIYEAENALTKLDSYIERLESNGWQDIESAPKGEKVIVTFTNSLGKRRTAFAVYYLKYTIEYDGDVPDWGEYKDDGECFCPEGWYEDIQSEVSEYGYFKLDYNPTHWQPLPAIKGDM